MAQENKAQASEIRYLNPVSVDVKKKKYCRFKKLGIKYVDYKDGEFLKKFLNEQGKILPRPDGYFAEVPEEGRTGR